MKPWDLAYFCCHPGAGASPERWNDKDGMNATMIHNEKWKMATEGVSEFLIHTVAVATLKLEYLNISQ